MSTKKKVNDFFQQASEAVSKGVDIIENEFEDRGINSKIKETSESIQNSAAGKKAASMTATASNTLDELSGKKILQLVEERLSLQEKYNDILAQKLEEALQRIQKLENK